MTAQFYFYRGEKPAGAKGTALQLDNDVITGISSFRDRFGEPTTLEVDALTIAASIFAVDRGQKRGEREDFARYLELHIPVVNIGRFQNVVGTIEKALRLLSNDTWKI